MHPSLNLNKLHSLSVTYRRMALSAVNGSTRDLTDLYRSLDRVSDADAKLFLPVFYLFLDPVGIPGLEELDDPDPDMELFARPFSAFMAIREIGGRVRFLNAVALDVWNRVWPWLEFFSVYGGNVPRRRNISDLGAYSLYADAVMLFRRYPAVSALMVNTPGVVVLLTRAWAMLVRAEPVDLHRTPRVLACIAQQVSRQDPLVYRGEDIIEGVGTVHELALLLTRYLGLINVFVRQDSPPHKIVEFWSGLLATGAIVGSISGTIIDALLAHGFLTELVRGYCIAGDNLPPNATFDDELFVTMLFRLLPRLPCYPWMAEALKAGLLRAILIAGQAPDVDYLLHHIIDAMLPETLVYHSVLSQLAISIPEVDDNPLIDTLLPELHADYLRFLDFAAGRLAVLDWYESDEYWTDEACYNMDCNKILERQDFRQCSVCRLAYYCSRGCQKADWRAGGHRVTCSSLRAQELQTHFPLSKRDTSFLRAVVQDAYYERRTEIRLQQLTHMHGLDPADGALPTVHFIFGYSRSTEHMRLEVLDPAPTPPAGDFGVDDTVWADWTARARRSGGRLELHVVSFGGIGRSVVRVIPLRSTSSTVCDALWRLAPVIPAGTRVKDIEAGFPAIWEELQRVLAADDLEEIH
ncbi:hypothetical protein DFH09DRAFT_1141171 [Mycena vulgaris]|nr:hypothetical protein DFH09DRAFT_1141171 [Mycena vulgaris]